MAIWKLKSKRKVSGGRYKMSHKKKSRDTGETPVYTKVGANQHTRIKRARGGSSIHALNVASHANISSAGKVRKTKILNVVENAASRNFVRQGVITKGAVIKISSGLARVTSRPTRDGVVNAVLIKK